MTVIEKDLAGVKSRFNLTFIGNVDGYPYRGKLLDELEKAGIDVEVNPHGRSEENLKGFIKYAEALRMSRITLNFTRCNGVPVTQLKTRMLEGALFGAVVATDSSLYADRYFSEGSEFISYNSPSDLRHKIAPLLEQPDLASNAIQRTSSSGGFACQRFLGVH